MKKFIPYAKQSIEPTDVEEVNKALQQEMITRGPYVEAFEKAVAEYCGAAYAVAFNSGTSALYGAYYAADVSAHDICLTTPNTFIATAGGPVYHQATPVFVDIDRKTGNLDLELLKLNLYRKPSRGRTIILPVHFAGIPVNIKAIDDHLQDPEAMIIEDGAHALGSCYADGQKVGSCAWSAMTMFSFHPAKQITSGEGGMVLTNDEHLYRRLRAYRNNGIEREEKYLIQGEEAPWYYEVQDVTGNYHMTDMQAALGLSQFKRLDAIVAKRRSLVKLYRTLLKDVPHVTLFTSEFDDQVSFHLFVAQIDFSAYKTNRTRVMARLKEKGVGTQYHYIPLYRHPCFSEKIGDISEFFPEMEAYYAQALSLPLYYDLSEEEVGYVVSVLKECLNK